MGTFADTITNRRFKEVFDELKSKKKIKTKSDLAQKLGTYNHVVNLILKGERGVTVEQISKLCNQYNIDANYLLGFTEQMYQAISNLPTLSRASISDLRQNITLVPKKALAGYAMNPGDWTFLDSLQRFSIPGLDGNLTAFEISGDSMLPTITNGDVVICEPMERGEPIRDNQVYVIVTDVVVAKRIQQLKQGAQVTKLRLISDNGDVYLPYDINLDDVQQIMRVKCRLTSHAIA